MSVALGSAIPFSSGTPLDLRLDSATYEYNMVQMLGFGAHSAAIGVKPSGGTELNIPAANGFGFVAPYHIDSIDIFYVVSTSGVGFNVAPDRTGTVIATIALSDKEFGNFKILKGTLIKRAAYENGRYNPGAIVDGHHRLEDLNIEQGMRVAIVSYLDADGKDGVSDGTFYMIGSLKFTS